MALIGINSVQKDPRKPSTLEQIAMGVDVASKVLDTGINAYKVFGIDKPRGEAASAQDLAQAKYYESQAQKGPKNDLSDMDKAYISSYEKNNQITNDIDPDHRKFAVTLPDSKKVILYRPRDPEPEKIFTAESKLRNDFAQDQGVKNFRTLHEATKATMDQFKGKDLDKGDPGSDIALLYNFIKTMDQNSSVRDGEVHLTTSSSPILDQAILQYKKLYSDKVGVLPPIIRKSLIATMEDAYGSHRQGYEVIAGQYRQAAQNQKINPDLVITPLSKIEFPERVKQNIQKITQGAHLKPGDVEEHDGKPYVYLGGEPGNPQSWKLK